MCVTGMEKADYLSEGEDFEAKEGSLGTRHKRHNQLIAGAPRTTQLEPQHGDPPVANPGTYGIGWP
jgi:hypothetical protein